MLKTTNSPSHVSIRTSLAATIAAATVASTLSADFTTRRWGSDTNYELRISHMTDFDQNRGGLPGGGANYCYPTATANLFAYIAQHGYAYCAPGNFDWQSNSNHTRATEFIDKLGDLMDTGASTGTEHRKGYRGAREMLRDEVGSRFVIEEENWTIFNVVSLKEMTKQSIDDRAVQSFCYGKYEVLGTNDCDERAIKRDGGHCMTFVGALRSGSTREITYHDPDGTTDSTSTQSTFTATTKDCPWVDDLVVFPTLTGSCWGFNQSMSRIMRSTDDGYLRLIDRRLAIRPASSYSWGSYAGFADGGVEIRTDSLGWGEDDGGVRASRVSSTIIGNPAKASLIVSPSGVPYFVVPGAQGGLFVEVRGDQGAHPVAHAEGARGESREPTASGDREGLLRACAACAQAEAPDGWACDVPACDRGGRGVDERQQRRLQPVNSVWFTCSGELPPTATKTADSPLHVARTLAPAALAEDWPAYAQAWAELDATAILALLKRQQAGQIVRLSLCGERASLTLQTAPKGLLAQFKQLTRRPAWPGLLQGL
jgi:hypothetical protein